MQTDAASHKKEQKRPDGLMLISLLLIETKEKHTLQSLAQSMGLEESPPRGLH